MVYSLEKILNPYSAGYGTAVSIIKAVSALYTMSDLANDLFTPPAHAALHPAPPKLKKDSQRAEAEPLQNILKFKLCDGAENRKHKLARGSSGINSLFL